MRSWWNSLATGARIVLVAGCIAVVLALGAAAWALWRPDPAVLFSDLRPQDAASISAELDKLKVPYTVADHGSTLLVDRSQVHAVRLKLMGRDMPLHGTVGLELFNTTDFGMTEFAQKVNFQRALQGELTRTILSFPEIRDARVHLVLPEQGLFKQHAARAKAAVTLGLRQGQALRPEQVLGIQRLVAAAVPALMPQEVTIVDQQGISLSRPAESEDNASGNARLDLKKETEAYLARKASAVLDQALGAGQALASVDVTLNMDQVRVTTEDVLPAADGKAGVATGVLLRERESARDNASADPRSEDTRNVRGSSMQRDVEYQAGRRVEQVVIQPGAIRRLQVVAVLREPMEGQKVADLERVLAAAVGAAADRGDTVVVQSLRPRPTLAVPAAPVADVAPRAVPEVLVVNWLVIGAVCFPALCMMFVLLRLRRRRLAVAHLSEDQRRAALQRLQHWMLEASVRPQTPVRQPGAVK